MSIAKELLRTDSLRRAARTAADWVDLQWSYILADLRSVAPRVSGELLDVGCGDKPYEPIFAPYVSRYVGIEHEATFRATYASARERAPDLYYDGRRLPFGDNSFDTVISIQVLEHTPDPAALVAEMIRVLRPGGALVLSVPFSFRLHEEPHDYFRYTSHGLTALCERYGASVVEIAALGSVWSVVSHKLNSYLAFHVARLDGFAQSLGKMNHEGKRAAVMRTWTLPFVLPTMATLSASARVLDRVLPDATETLSFRVLARKRG